MSLLELLQMPILTITSWLCITALRELRRWSRAAGLGQAPERQLAAPAEGRARGPGEAAQQADAFVAGAGARVFSLEAFRRARQERPVESPRVA